MDLKRDVRFNDRRHLST